MKVKGFSESVKKRVTPTQSIMGYEQEDDKRQTEDDESFNDKPKLGLYLHLKRQLIYIGTKQSLDFALGACIILKFVAHEFTIHKVSYFTSNNYIHLDNVDGLIRIIM